MMAAQVKSSREVEGKLRGGGVEHFPILKTVYISDRCDSFILLVRASTLFYSNVGIHGG